MSVWTYLAIALITMEADALACSVSGVRYRVVVSAVLSLMWPVTTPCVITAVIMAQNSAMRINEAENAGKEAKE